MMKNSSNIVQSHATGSSGPDAAHSQGSSRTRIHLCTPDFLAAAADKFFSLSAEDLADAIAPIVPNIAACRGAWKSKFWAGSYLLAMETPESCKAEMSQWKSDGIACLSIEEIDATVMCIAKIIKAKSGTFNMAGPWYRHVRNEFPGHELPLFTSLTEEQTFNFVLELCPHLKRLHDAWVLNGLTGRELLAMSPATFIEVLFNLHELVPGTAKLAPHQVPRVHEAIRIALKNYVDSGHEDAVSAALAEHEEYCRSGVR
jgi:hypothetical protein